MSFVSVPVPEYVHLDLFFPFETHILLATTTTAIMLGGEEFFCIHPQGNTGQTK